MRVLFSWMIAGHRMQAGTEEVSASFIEGIQTSGKRVLLNNQGVITGYLKADPGAQAGKARADNQSIELFTQEEGTISFILGSR